MSIIKSAMAGLSLGIASLGLSILPAANAYAAIVTYDFVGSVSFVSGTPAGFVASIGDQVTGTFSYDDSVADTDLFESTGRYPQSIFQGMFLSLLGNDFSASSYFMDTNNNPDADTVQPDASGTVFLNAVFDPNLRFGIDFQDTTATFLSDAGLPSSLLPLSNFDFANGFIQNTVTLDLIRFDVTSLTAAVPEPATLALFGIGVAALGFARRRKMA